MTDVQQSTIYDAPIGPLELKATEHGLISVVFLFGGCGSKLGTEREQQKPPQLQKMELTEEEEKAKFHLDICRQWLDAYFSGMLLKMKPLPQRPMLALPEKGM